MGVRHEVSIYYKICAINLIGDVSDIWGVWVLTKQSYEIHFILKCLRKRNTRKVFFGSLKEDEKEFSFTLESLGERKFCPFKNQELSLLILNL